MRRYEDTVTSLTSNNLEVPVVGASVTVKIAGTSTLASLFLDDGVTPGVNPVTTDAFGRFAFFVADGKYDLTVTGTNVVIQTQLSVSIVDTLEINTGDLPENFNAQRINNVRFADQFAGADLAAKINAAIADLPSTGGIVDATALTTPQTLGTVVSISKPVWLKLPATTLTATMADPGTASGVFNVTSNDVTIEGQGTVTTLTQGTAANIQTFIYLGAQQRVSIRRIKISGNEANQTRPSGQFYTGIRNANGSDIRIESCEFTQTGDRSIDLRASSRNWILNNYFHQTGIAAGGSGTGSAVSVSVNGTGVSSDSFVYGNQIEEWGDTALSAADHGKRIYVAGNTIRGRADFGNTPSSIESAIDVVGVTDATVVGNIVRNVANFYLDSESQQVGGVTYVPSNIRIVGNEFYHDLSSTADPLVNISCSLIAGQITGAVLSNNQFNGVRLAISDVDGLVVSGNTFTDICTKNSNVCLTLSQALGVTKNFTISGNTFETTNSSVTTAIFVGALVTTPGTSSLGPNQVSTTIATPVSNAGRAVPTQTLDNYQLYRRSADTVASIVDLLKARGTADSPTAVQSGDLFGQLNFWGHDGTNYVKSGLIQQNAQGAPSTGIVPSRMKFFAMNGSGSLTNLLTLLGDQGQLQLLGDFFPDVDGTRSNGIAGLRWGSLFALQAQCRRFRANQGTAFSGVDAAIVLSAGWGTTAAVSAASGFDQAFSFTATSNGTGQVASPTITITFKDGTWTAAPQVTVVRNDLNTPFGTPPHTIAVTATTLTITFNGTPTAATAYKYIVTCMGN